MDNERKPRKYYALDQEININEINFIKEVLTYTYKIDRDYYFELLGEMICDLNKSIFKIPDLTTSSLNQLLKNIKWEETSHECVNSNFYRLFYTDYTKLNAIPKVISINNLNDDVFIRLKYDNSKYFVIPFTDGLRWNDVKDREFQFLHLILFKQGYRWQWIDYSFGPPCQPTRLIRKPGRIKVKDAKILGIKWINLY